MAGGERAGNWVLELESHSQDLLWGLSSKGAHTSLHLPAYLLRPTLLPPGQDQGGQDPSTPLPFLGSCSVQPWRAPWGPPCLDSTSGQRVGSPSLRALIAGSWVPGLLWPPWRARSHSFLLSSPGVSGFTEQKAGTGPRARHLAMEVPCVGTLWLPLSPGRPCRVTEPGWLRSHEHRLCVERRVSLLSARPLSVYTKQESGGWAQGPGAVCVQ